MVRRHVVTAYAVMAHTRLWTWCVGMCVMVSGILQFLDEGQSQGWPQSRMFDRTAMAYVVLAHVVMAYNSYGVIPTPDKGASLRD